MKTYLLSLTALPIAVPATLLAALVFSGCSQSTHSPNTALEDTGNEAPNSVSEPAEFPSEPTRYEALRPTLEDEPNATTTVPQSGTSSADASQAEVVVEEDAAAGEATQPKPQAEEQPEPEESAEAAETAVPAEPVVVTPSEEEQQELQQEVVQEQQALLQADVDKAQQLKASLDQVEQELKAAQETLTAFTLQQESEEFKHQMREKLDELDAQIEPIQENAAALKEKAETRQKLLLEIKEQRQTFLDQLKSLDPANPEEAEPKQKTIQQEWEKLEELRRQLEQQESDGAREG